MSVKDQAAGHKPDRAGSESGHRGLCRQRSRHDDQLTTTAPSTSPI